MSRRAELVARGLREPHKAFRVFLSIARGRWYRWWLPLRGRRFRAGKNFRVNGRLIVRGPGQVEFGDDVLVEMTVTPWTYSPEAVIRIGDGTYLNGTSFGCQSSIEVGAQSILASARIMDTDFHSVRSDRHNPEAPIRVAAVRLGRNVWVAAEVGILPGTTIGDNSVVGFGAVCTGDYAADTIIAGNPARSLRPVPQPPGQVPP